jgi:adenosylcobinamide kinase/adenosylcobinamide-phosphate guanylyltransferase
MSKITFILGGAKSGKSTFAVKLALRYRKVAFIATAKALDKEMQSRIARHRECRPSHWKTFEEDLKITNIFDKIHPEFDCLVIDCLTLWVSNLLLAKIPPPLIEERARQLLKSLNLAKSRVIIVSNEVGLGIVPANKLARGFRDIAGSVNQIVAKNANEAYFMVSGIPSRIKNKKIKHGDY